MRKKEYLILPNGQKIVHVSEKKYKRYEKIRNYILRGQFETNRKLPELKYRAMSLFGISEREVSKALNSWLNWYYGKGIRHRPIEMFIEDYEKEHQSIRLVLK